MRLKEIPILQYLGYEEARQLVELLKQNNINARMHYMTSGEGNDLDIHQVLINESDLNLASIIIQKFQKRIKADRIRSSLVCPKCKSVPPVTHVIKNVSFFRKLISFGTTIMECDKCRKIWYI